MKKDQLDGLLALKLVAEKRNFTAAAEELGVSASAMSQMIKQLEARFGVTLLTRTTRSTSLTQAGEQFLMQSGPAIDQILAAIDAVGSFAEKPSGLLRINMPRFIYTTYLEEIVSSFGKKFPDVTLEVFLEDGASEIFENGFDAGIRLSDILAKDMVAIKIAGPIRFVVVASPKYLNKHGRPKHPRDLLGHNCICMRLGKSYVYDNWEFESKGREFRVHVKGSLIFNDSLLSLQSAVKGLGLSYMIEDGVSDYVKNGRLEIVLAGFASHSSGFYLYYPSRAQVLPKLRAFIDHMQEALA